MRRALFPFVVAAAVVAVALIAWFSNQSTDNLPASSDSGPASPRQAVRIEVQDTNQPGLPASSLAPSSLRPSWADYIEHKGSLRALAHKALSSTDAIEIGYAKLYLTRCRLTFWAAGLRDWTKSADSMRIENPKAAEAFRSFQTFCGDATTVDKGLEYALDERLVRLGNAPIDVNKPRDPKLLYDRIQDSIAKRSSELLIERLRDQSVDIELMNKWLVDQGIAKPSEVRDFKMQAVLATLVMTAASCEVWGCDMQLLRLNNCIAWKLCSDDAMSAPLSQVFEEQYKITMESNFGPDARNYPTWPEVLSRAVAMLRASR